MLTKKQKNDLYARLELALMGFVVNLSNVEIEEAVKYIQSVVNFGREDMYPIDGSEISKKLLVHNNVKHIVVNKLMGEMIVVTFLLESKTDEYPKPFEEDYGSGYDCSFCYALNLTDQMLSEYGDCFFRKDGNIYRRVS